MSMQTDELINILTQSPPPRRPLRLGLCGLAVTMGAAIVTIAVLGVRAELAAGQPPLSFWIKTAMLAAMLIVSLRALSRAATPLAVPQTRWLEQAVAIMMAALVAAEWAGIDHGKILNGFLVPNFPCCLLCVTLYGAAGMAVFTWLMRRYAPANVKNCAGLIGFAAAAAGAVGYSIHCPLDSPTFVVVAYGLPMLGLGLIGRRILPRFLNW